MWPYDMNQGFPQMGGYGQQMGNGGFGQYQPQATGADQGNARIDKLKGRVSNLQEQMKGAGTQDMAGIQARMDKMRGRIKGLRQDRRQGEGMYGQPAGQQGGAQPEPGMVRDIRGNLVQGGRGGPVQLPNDIGGQFAPMNNGPYFMGSNNPNFGMGGGQMGGASQYGGGFPQGFGQMQNGYGMNPMQYGGGMYGGGMGGMGEGAFRGGYNPNQNMGGGYSGDYQSQVGQYQQRLAQYQQQAAANGGNGGSAGPPAPPMGMYDNNGNLTQGANRPGMQYRQDRRQARQGEAGPGAPNPGAQPVAPQQGGGWNPGTTPTSMGNMFDTGWGRLVASSTGNQNVMQLENDPSRLFHYDPNAQNGPGAKNGWKSMTPDEYKSYGDYNYQDPRAFGAAASPMMQNWTQKNGFWQGAQGSGAYA